MLVPLQFQSAWSALLGVKHLIIPLDTCLLFDTNMRSQINRLRAAIDLLVFGSAIALCVVCLAVKLFAALAGAQDVVVGGKRVAKFT